MNLAYSKSIGLVAIQLIFLVFEKYDLHKVISQLIRMQDF